MRYYYRTSLKGSDTVSADLVNRLKVDGKIVKDITEEKSANSAGQTVTLYGGTIHRSIGYIAYQNRAAFKSGTAQYAFLWDIIHYVYGTRYDAEYRK